MAIKEIAPHSIPTTEKNEGYKKPLDIQFVNNSIPENEEKNNTYNNISNKNYKPFISNNSINKIKNEVNIVDICRNYGIKVEKGKALCPFHDEKTPSMSINYKNTNRYHCFGCGESGDVINFVMKMENLDFLSATEKIANDFGIFLEYENLTEEQIKNIEIERKIYKRYEELQEFYTESLFSEEGRQALEYLRSRGLSENIIKEYGVGYAPKYIKEKINEIFKGINKENLVEYKIIKEWKKEDGEVVYFPLLQNRITFPLTKNNEIIGFQGRAIDLDEKIRYLTATKELFIWNIDVIKKNKEINLTEGIIDALTLIQADKENTIALLGTQAITKNTEKIFKNTEKINFWLDDDNAGKEAEEKYSKIFGNKTTIIPLKFKDSIKTKLSKGEEGYELEKATVEGFIENNKKDLNGIFQLYLLKNENNFEKAIQEYKNFLNNCEKNSYTILEKKYEEFLALDDIEKAKQTKEFIKFIYEFNQGNTDIINVFRDKLKKDAKINFGRFDEIIEEIEEELALNFQEAIENNTIPEWKIIGRILYKNVYDPKISDFKPKKVTRTIPKITKILKDIENETYKIEISYIGVRGNHETVVLDSIATKKSILEALEKKDFDVNESNIIDVMNYLRYINLELGQTTEIENITERFGWHNDFKTFILGEDVLGEDVVKFRGAGLGETQKAQAYVTKGNLEDWKKIVPLIKDKKLMMMELYTSFLPPLLPILEQNNFVLSNFGETSSGKTLTNRVAGSVWGNTNKNANVESSIFDGNHMTLDKLEKSLAMHSHIPIFINDTHNMRKNVSSKMMYFVESGNGGGRGTVGDGSQGIRKIRTILFGTSEAPLLSDGASKNKGELARGFEFYGSPLEEDNIKLALEIEDIINNNYGIAGRIFVQNLIDRNGNFENIIEKHKKLQNMLIDENQSNILNRLIPNLAGVIVSGILANEILELGLTEEKIIKDVMDCVETVKEEIDDVAYYITALETVEDFLSINQNMFYYQGKTEVDDVEDLELTARAPYGNKNYGIWRDDEGYVGVIKTVLENYLKQEDIDPKRCYRGWREEGIIDADKNRFTKTIYNPQTKTAIKVIKFQLDKLYKVIGK